MKARRIHFTSGAVPKKGDLFLLNLGCDLAVGEILLWLEVALLFLMHKKKKDKA